MRRKKIFEYHDNLTMKIEITLTGTALDIEKYRRSILAIHNNLDSVTVSRAKVEQQPKVDQS
jgi:hypothetical protein